MRLVAWALPVLFFFSSVAAQPSGTAEEVLQKSVTEKMQVNGIVGMSAAIIVRGKVVWMKGFGFADREAERPFTPQTVMNIASVSKVVTGVCLMKAVQDGLLSLDADINMYLPFRTVNPYFPGEKITLRQLATHTSSLNDRYPFYTDSTYFDNRDAPEPLGEFLQAYFVPGGKYYSVENFLKEKPGTFREYANTGAGLAGFIVERRTGMKLNVYSRKWIFNPLQMKSTGWFFQEFDAAKHATLYEKQGDSIRAIPLYGETTYPDGGVHTTVEELSRFFIMLLNGGRFGNKRVLKKASVAEMLRFQFTTDHAPRNVKPDKLNSGIFWATKLGGLRVGHNGSDKGVRTFMLTDLSREVGVILFVNTSLGEEKEKVYFDLYEDLYQYGKQFADRQKK